MSKIFLLLLAAVLPDQDIVPRWNAPYLAMESAYGKVNQSGATVTVCGEHWLANGWMKLDGANRAWPKVILLWVEVETGRAGIGSYFCEDGAMWGRFGWVDQCWLDGDDLKGITKAHDIIELIRTQSNDMAATKHAKNRHRK